MQKKSLEAIQEFSPSGFVRRRVWQSAHLHCNIYCFEPANKTACIGIRWRTRSFSAGKARA